MEQCCQRRGDAVATRDELSLPVPTANDAPDGVSPLAEVLHEQMADPARR